MRLRDLKDGYNYICTHVDDFKFVTKDPNIWIDKISKKFLVKSHGPWDYYLDNDYTFYDDEDIWTYG